MKEFFCKKIQASIVIGDPDSAAPDETSNCPFNLKCRMDEFCEHLDLFGASGRGVNPSSGKMNPMLRDKRC